MQESRKPPEPQNPWRQENNAAARLIVVTTLLDQLACRLNHDNAVGALHRARSILS